MLITMKRKRNVTNLYIDDKLVYYKDIVFKIFSEYFKIPEDDLKIEERDGGLCSDGFFIIIDGETRPISWNYYTREIKDKEQLQKMIDTIICDCKRVDSFLNDEYVESIEVNF